MDNKIFEWMDERKINKYECVKFRGHICYPSISDKCCIDCYHQLMEKMGMENMKNETTSNQRPIP